MGWHHRDFNEEDWWFNEAGEPQEPISFWSPTTDWRAAGSVFERLDSLAFHPSLEGTGGPDADFPDGWRVEFYNHREGKWDAAWAETAPLAICLAALKAINQGGIA